MTSLTIEMGLRRRRGDSPPVPDQLAHRQDVTLAQKQRLAMLAKMGVGPVAKQSDRAPPDQLVVPRGIPPPLDRRRALLEQERRMREQEERQREQEEQEEVDQREKVRAKREKEKARKGLGSLGPVLPREETVPMVLPAPVEEPAPRREPPVLRLADAMERQRIQALETAEDEDSPDEDEAEDPQKKGTPSKDKQKRRPEDQRPKPGKKKKKKRPRDEAHWDDWPGGEEDAWEEEEQSEEARPRDQEWKGVRDGGINKNLMVVESVKGKVSHANKNFTDADLERRFQMQESESHGSLMTEEQVLRMIRKEKAEKGTAGSASRRVQRELAEWASSKEQHRARVKSPHRFERMVVARK